MHKISKMEALFIWISLSKLVKILKNIQVFNELGDANQVKKLMPLSHMNRFIKIVKLRCNAISLHSQSAVSYKQCDVHESTSGAVLAGVARSTAAAPSNWVTDRVLVTVTGLVTSLPKPTIRTICHRKSFTGVDMSHCHMILSCYFLIILILINQIMHTVKVVT